MKITAIESRVLRVPTPHPICLEFAEHRLVTATIRTDDGPTGFGYSLVFGGAGAEAVQVYLETRLKPLLIGENPLLVERLWDRMFRVDRGIRRQGLAGYAVAALDIGLWDLVGKVAGLPLYKLWGAVTDRIPAYGSGGWPRYSVDDLIGEAKRYAAMGCRYYKMKIHHPDPRVNRVRVEAVKKAVGDDVRLMVDVNQKLDVLGNVRQARLLAVSPQGYYEVILQTAGGPRRALFPIARTFVLAPGRQGDSKANRRNNAVLHDRHTGKGMGVCAEQCA